MYKLIIEDDEGKTTVVPLIRDEITIGRKEGNTIRLTERNVSRRHAKLSKANGTIYIEDLQSFNGIRVNGDRISGRAPVTEGDRIQIGDYQLALKLDKAAAGVPEPSDTDSATIPFVKEDLRATSEAPTRAVPILASGPPPEAPPPPMAAAPVASTPPRLVVVSSNFAGKEFRLLKDQNVIGRTDENDVVINHRSISRHHAKVVKENGRYQIVDLGSANGVRVNGEDYGKVELRKGDLIDLGHVRLRFVASGEDFVFSRDAQVVDVQGTDKKSPLPLILGAVGALLLVAVIAVFALRGGGGGKAAPDGAKVAEINLAVDKALAALDWDVALDKATEGLALDPNNATLREKKARAESEKKTQAIYADYAKAAKAGDNETAVLKYQEIPESSAYHEKAQDTWAVLRNAYVAFHLGKARELQMSGRCDDAKTHLQAVLLVDEGNSQATDIATKCGQPALPRPTRGPTPRPAVATRPVATPRPEAAPAEAPRPAETPKPAPVVEAPRPAPPPPPPKPAAPSGDDLIAKAQELYVGRDYDGAMEKAQQALKSSPGSAAAWKVYGMSACFKKDADAAQKAYGHLVANDKVTLRYICSKFGQINLQ